MVYCDNCGARLRDGARFCHSCGRAVYTSYGNTHQHGYYKGSGYGGFGLKDIEENKGMAVLAYLSILVVIPIIVAKNSPYAKFHANQGLILLIFEIICGFAFSIISSVFFRIFWVLGVITSSTLSLVYLGFIAFSVYGIINAINGQAKELPLLGWVRIIN